MELTGPRARDFVVEYRAHQQGEGDIGPKSNGQFLGSRGKSRRIEAIHLVVKRAR